MRRHRHTIGSSSRELSKRRLPQSDCLILLGFLLLLGVVGSSRDVRGRMQRRRRGQRSKQTAGAATGAGGSAHQ